MAEVDPLEMALLEASQANRQVDSLEKAPIRSGAEVEIAEEECSIIFRIIWNCIIFHTTTYSPTLAFAEVENGK